MTLPSSPSADGNPTTPVRVDAVGRTDVGRTREHNEDSFLVADLTAGSALPEGEEVDEYPVGERGLLCLVADGMGGAAAGEIASDLAVQAVLETLLERWTPADDASPQAFVHALRTAAEVANARIHEMAQQHLEYRGMGTTLTMAGLLGGTLYLAQVGDSRAYLVRGGHARQITKDQSLMQKLVEAGEITAEEAERSDRRNIILQALGPESTVAIDLTDQPVRRGDILVLCSDGLSSLVRPEEIARAVTEAHSLDAACRQLIDRANASGGPDNITVVAVRLSGTGLQDPSDADAVGYHSFEEPATEEPQIPPSLAASLPTPDAGVPAVPTPPSEPRFAVVPRREGQKWVVALGALAVVSALAVIWQLLKR
ncbi:MAG TPA: Stp1/IreP family PP2C-type Ser/Thr phosphatase [Gemmatimonadaceae bacterium]|nr:Stp1/IreP family PP2C-type Ser/Thr phosphatase [Gemmatimonadaceae bacterium]